MHQEEFLELLRGMEGVVRAEPLGRDQAGRLIQEECSIDSVSGGLRMECPGIASCLSRDSIYVLFCDEGFRSPSTMVMELVDERGVVIGHNVPEHLMPRFADRDDVIWLSDHFVIYARKIGCYDAKLVMKAVRLEEPSLGLLEPWIYYPAPSSARLLNSMFGNPDGGLASVVLGVDGLLSSVPVPDVVKVPCAGRGHGEPSPEDTL